MDIVNKLSELVIELYNETADYQDNPADAQLWYNRGYANGVVDALKAKKQADAMAAFIDLDEANLYAGESVMEWHKAYHHGFEMGQKEALEVL
jgi:hypothetical protein